MLNLFFQVCITRNFSAATDAKYLSDIIRESRESPDGFSEPSIKVIFYFGLGLNKQAWTWTSWIWILCFLNFVFLSYRKTQRVIDFEKLQKWKRHDKALDTLFWRPQFAKWCNLPQLTKILPLGRVCPLFVQHFFHPNDCSIIIRMGPLLVEKWGEKDSCQAIYTDRAAVNEVKSMCRCCILYWRRRWCVPVQTLIAS